MRNTNLKVGPTAAEIITNKDIKQNLSDKMSDKMSDIVSDKVTGSCIKRLSARQI